MERYYEKKLEVVTKSTPFAYRHRNPVLSLCYLIYCMVCTGCCKWYDSEKFQKLLSSDSGIQLYEYFFNSNDIDTSSGNKVKKLELF